MAKPLSEAAMRLVEVLRRENGALEAMDLRLAASLLTEKTAAIEDLASVADGAVLDGEVASTARRLDELATVNRALLKRAIAAQQRVIGIVVKAAATAAPAACYGTKGRQTRPSGPVTLFTRA